MNHLFVPHEIAKKLKEKGFNEDCLTGYSNLKNFKELSFFLEKGMGLTHKNSDFGNLVVTAPLWQQAIDWLRDEHDIHVLPVLTKKGFYQWQIYHKPKEENTVFSFECDYKTNRTHVIEEAIKLI